MTEDCFSFYYCIFATTRAVVLSHRYYAHAADSVTGHAKAAYALGNLHMKIDEKAASSKSKHNNSRGGVESRGAAPGEVVGVETQRYFRRASQLGHPQAQVKMAKMILDKKIDTGDGIDSVVRLFRMSAQQGSMEGLTGLGDLYMDGTGVEKSIEQAIECYQEAVDAGYIKAEAKLKNAKRIAEKLILEYDE